MPSSAVQQNNLPAGADDKEADTSCVLEVVEPGEHLGNILGMETILFSGHFFHSYLLGESDNTRFL